MGASEVAHTGRKVRHARTCCGLPRLAGSATAKKDVGGRDKPGHDGVFGPPNKTGPANIAGPALAYRYPTWRQTFVMSTSLVSGRKISATMKLIAAIPIGYQRPQ